MENNVGKWEQKVKEQLESNRSSLDQQIETKMAGFTDKNDNSSKEYISY